MSAPTSVKKAVDGYAEVDSALKDFMDEHNDIFGEFFRLVEARNAACEKARALVKKHESSHGDFRYSTARRYSFDVDTLQERLPKEIFSRITKVAVDRKAVEVLLERGELSEDDLEGAYEVGATRKCSGPSSWLLGG